jgi:PA-IL-like protein
MMISRTVVALSIAAFAVTGTASAQENATFTLRSGERLSGQLMDLGGVGFTVRVNDQERRIPANDVAVIDFTGAGTSQSDWDRLSNGQFAVLKDGQIVTGQLTDVGGSSPLRLSFSVNGANRDIQSNAVARIVLARPNDAPTTSTPSTPSTDGAIGTSGIMVPARQRWTATGLTVRRGETLTVSATGEIRFAASADAKASPNGSSERPADNPVPNATTGTLIGRIGNGQPFAIGSQTSFQAPAAGQLFLGVNDTHLDDNDGSFQVQVRQSAVRTRR